MVIVIAATIEERSRLATALDGTSLVLLVSNAAEALEYLNGISTTTGPAARSATPSVMQSFSGVIARPVAGATSGRAASLGRAASPSRAATSGQGAALSAGPPPNLSPTPTVTPGAPPPTPLPIRTIVEPAPGLEVDSDWRVARCEGREVGLTPLEHDLLVCLLERLGHIETFESLQRRVWGNDHLGGRSHVQSVVKRLRRKLHELASPLQIDAVRGVGLRLIDSRAGSSIHGYGTVVPHQRSAHRD